MAARPRLALLAVAAALLAAPSGGQVAPDSDAAPPPKSLLPDSFGPVAPEPVAPATPLLRPLPPSGAATPAAAPPGDATAAAVAPAAPVAGAAIDLVGPLTPALGGYGESAFAESDGRFVAGLLRRLTTPLASRWAHIVLRRALATRAAAPAGVSPGDWIAERARILLALGEVDAAKALLDNLPVDRMTPRLIRVAGQVSLAAADLPGLCPIADAGGAVSPDPVWRLATAICAALAGDDISGSSAFDAIRRDGKVDPFDIHLGERIAMISGGGGRAANLDWDGANTITPYRFGVAAAAGVAVPLARLTELAAATGGTSWGWVLRAPAQTAEGRAAALMPAAALGIASVSDVVSAVANASADLDRSAFDASPAGTLRDAYVGPTTAARVTAMRTVWTSGTTEAERYAARIETGIAAARLPVDRAAAPDAADLIAAMLAAGIEPAAKRWWPVVAGSDDAASRAAWALLAVGVEGGISVSPERFRAYAKDVAPHRAALLFAALDGLGYTTSPRWDELRRAERAPTATSWSRAIDAAGAAHRPGEVAILAATGLQTRWSAVPPAHLAHIIAAYRAAGLGHEARMLAAEAVTRG